MNTKTIFSSLLIIFFINLIDLNGQIRITTFNKQDSLGVFCKIENEIMVTAPGIDPTTLAITTTNGSAAGEKGAFYITPSKYSKSLTIKVFSKGILIGSQKLNVLKIPDPELCYNDDCGDDLKVSMAMINVPLLIRIRNFNFSTYATILSFTAKVNGKTFKSTSNEFSKEARSFIKDAGKGTQVIISKIKCSLPFGETRTLKRVKITFN